VSCYERGEKVWWISPIDGSRTKAVFVEHDRLGYPNLDCILAIKIHTHKHSFRWPLKYIRKI